MSQSSIPSLGPRKVIIIGAGIYGLVAAKTYLEINPEIELIILDADSSVGGVWSATRVYAGLVADIPAPAFEFSDLRMTEEFGIAKWTDIPGKMLYEYLERYAKKFDILRRCKLNTEVISVDREGISWRVHTRPVGDVSKAKEETLTCDVLLVATGIHSKPKFPDIDTSTFEGLVVHTKDLHKRHDDLVSEKVKTIAVVGGNKSSVEAVSACARAGKQVHWLIRENGAGPGLLLNAKLANGKQGPQVGLCRVTEFNHPTIFGYRGWWDRFFLSGKYSLGAKIFNWFWNAITTRGLGDRYEKSENGRLLKPNLPNIFWTASGISIAHEAELKFLDIVNEGKLVHVARTSIESMGPHTIGLSNGKSIEADAVIFATGWESSCCSLFSPSMLSDLGLPMPLNSLSGEESAYWKALDAAADKEVLEVYPSLLNRPKEVVDRKISDTPFRIFRTIIPPKLASRHDRSIVFLGQLANTQHTFFAEISTLWSIAYLEGLLPDGDLMGNKDAMDWEIALMLAFMRWRYPGRKNVPFAVFEIRDWMDKMLKELGLRTDRNRLHWVKTHPEETDWWAWKAWMFEWFEPYEPEVYKGIVQEFLDEIRERKGECKKTR